MRNVSWGLMAIRASGGGLTCLDIIGAAITLLHTDNNIGNYFQ
jgi:hypothetical protein